MNDNCKPFPCPDCGHTVKKSDISCPNCGRKVSNLYPCPDCGAPVSKSAEKCPNCGRKLVSEEQKMQAAIGCFSTIAGAVILWKLGVFKILWSLWSH